MSPKSSPEDFEIPSKQSSVEPETKNTPQSDSDTNSNEEGVYNVERLCSHKMSNELINGYWEEQKKKGTSREDIIQQAKSVTVSKDSAKKRVLADSKRLDHDNDDSYDQFPPTDESWESLVSKIDTVDRDPNIGLIVCVKWKNGKNSIHPASVIHRKCPLKLIEFYETLVRFSSEPLD
ncbi:hypothetical protein BB560_007132 [Smittium megazygosporum]|uniref:Chromo shadow domain-containing protein n=1 Tax=Smittium megazygosporum TaxID=133381 RepID=A0A2T9XYK8_9FUNG|nr:hypothetical protein BB560_007132 [Smittium megazygosporum]